MALRFTAFEDFGAEEGAAKKVRFDDNHIVLQHAKRKVSVRQ